MWSVVVYDQNQTEIGRSAILPDQVIYLGSAPENHVVIPDGTIPPQQAYLYLTEGYPVVEDAGTGSTVLDGYQLTEAAYITGDNQIVFGAYSLYVFYEEVEALPPPPDDLPPPPPPPDDMVVYPPAAEYGDEYVAQSQPEYSGEQYAPEEYAAPASGGMLLENQPYEDYSSPDPAMEEAGVQFGADAVLAIENKELKLIAREGYLDGREFVLAYDDTFDIGRSPEVEILVDDPSVSRVHARLKLEAGGTLTIQDLRSTNGTFINGKLVKRDIASLGDRIRIGEIPFLFTTSTDSSSGDTSGIAGLFKSKKFIFVASGLFFFMTLVVVLKVAMKNRPVKKKSIVAKKIDFQESLNLQVARLKAEAKSLAEVDQWDAAISKYKSALSLMPDDKSIKESLSHATFENRNFKVFTQALELKNRMNHEGRLAALAKFAQIDKKSQYYRSELAPIIMDLKKALARTHRDSGLAEAKSNYPLKAGENLCAYFELDSGLDDLRGEEKIRLELRHLHRANRWNKKFHVCTAPRYLHARIMAADVATIKAGEQLKKLYFKGIADAVISYFAGNPKDAILKLDELTKSWRGKRVYKDHIAKIIELKEQMQNIIQSYEAGETKIQQNNLDGALAEWKTLLKLDEQICGKTIKSRYRRNVANRLASRYYKDGKKELAFLRYEEAFKLFSHGLALDPDDTTELRAGVKELEQKALELFDEAIGAQQSGNPALAKKLSTRILNMTLPDSPTHKKVQKALGSK
ncbi:FHA domain-containing protein [Myxococcota bacterium]|nr:FHA domain-containing protein [Myxococcota bacterium]